MGVITLDRKFGVLTNADGQFVLTGLPASATILVEIMGYKTQEFKVSGIPQGERLDIYLELDSETLQETVVTGIFTRRKDSFTGSGILNPVRPVNQYFLIGTAGIGL